MMLAFEIVYGLAIWSSPIFLLFKIFFDTYRAMLLTLWVVGSIFFIFFLGFGVGVGLTYALNSSGWEKTIDLGPNIMNWWLNGNWIGDGDYHDIPFWAILVTPYVFLAHWLTLWFNVVFLNGHLVLAVITAFTFTIFLKFSIPFLSALNWSRFINESNKKVS